MAKSQYRQDVKPDDGSSWTVDELLELGSLFSYGAFKTLEAARSQVRFRVISDPGRRPAEVGMIGDRYAIGGKHREAVPIRSLSGELKTVYLKGDGRRAKMERETAAFRERRAWEHKRRASAAVRENRLTEMELVQVGLRMDEAKRLLQVKGARGFIWHTRRANGACERFSRIEDCGSEILETVCDNCKEETAGESRCGVQRICVKCRSSKTWLRRRRFGRARLVELERVQRAQLDRGRERWTEKLLTLTVPHVGSSAQRVGVLFAAWRKFSIRMQRFFARHAACGRRCAVHGCARVRPGMPSVAWYRAFECTRGDDGLGHPHFHVWMLSPYLPGGHEASIGGIDRVSEWWTKAIVEAGGTPCESGGNYELHAVRGDASEIRRELLKKDGNAFKMRIGNSAGEQVFEYSDGWSTEDLEDVVLASRLYEALEGRRMTQAARRFLEARERGCTFCKCERCVRVTSYRSDAWYERDEARRVEEAYLAAERGSLGGSPEG